MVELENTLVPPLTEYMECLKRYVDAIICFAEMGFVECTVSMQLNTFDTNIQFTYETKKKVRLPFLDVLLTRNGNNIVNSTYRKTHNK